MDLLAVNTFQSRAAPVYITVGWTCPRTNQWCKRHPNLLGKLFLSRREMLVHGESFISSTPSSSGTRTWPFTMVDRLFSQIGTIRWRPSKKPSINRLVLISYRFGSVNSCVWRRWKNNSKSRSSSSILPGRTTLIDSFRLGASHLMDQIDNERLQFTYTDIATQPRVPVRGLWILKFVQSL